MLADVELLHQRRVRPAQALARSEPRHASRAPARPRSTSRRLCCSSPGRSSASSGSQSTPGRLAKLVPDAHHVRLHARGDVERAGLPGGGQQRAHDIADVHVVARRLPCPNSFGAWPVCRRCVKIDTTPASPCGLCRGPYTLPSRHTAFGTPSAATTSDVGLRRPLRRAVGGQRRGDLLLAGRPRRLVAVQRSPGGGEHDRDPPLVAASTTFSVPCTFTSQSRPGFSTETTTLACAAKWNTALGPPPLDAPCTPRGRRCPARTAAPPRPHGARRPRRGRRSPSRRSPRRAAHPPGASR